MTPLPSPESAAAYPDNPVVGRVWRGGAVESVHRGSWVVADAAGDVLAGAGDHGHAYYARSTVKALQALPLLESGAAERFDLTDRELALALASHNGEARHTEVVAGLLARLGLGVEALRCGAQVPGDPTVREELRRTGARPSALHNNCSGKHAGFLALALHLGVDPADYLDPSSEGQRQVLRAVAGMCGVEPERVALATDGCSAPTFALPLARLAGAFARLCAPDGLEPRRAACCRRMTDVVARFPELVAGEHKRLCTDLSRATAGRLFPKIGAEAVYVVGDRASGRALALKLDDGLWRGLHPVLLGLLEREGFATAAELEPLAGWRDPVRTNHAGLEVGRFEVVP